MKQVVLLTVLFLAQDPAPARVTFARDVAPIVFQNCASCHRPDEAAPFPLLTYGDIKKRAKQILTAIETRQMPPWKPVEGYGDFVGERRMKASDLETFRTWVDQGCLEGEAKDLPPLPKFPDGWAWGEPDLVVSMPEPYAVPAEGRDLLRAFIVPLKLTETRYVRAIQVRPRNMRVIHHVLVFLDSTSESRKKDEADPGPGFEGRIGLAAILGGTLGEWLPGNLTSPFPDGMAKEVKRNADLVLQMHFNPIGRVVQEQTEVALWFTKKPPRRMVVPVPLFNVQFDLLPGRKDLQVASKYLLPVDVDVIAIQPHAHYLGRECKIWAKDPAGKEIPLVWVKDWNFDWQEQYRFKELIRLPKGTEVNMVWTYDNTASNPKNPWNPPRRVRFGERTGDEMALARLEVATFNASDKMKLYFNLLAIPGEAKDK